MAKVDITIEQAIQYHLRQIRRFGLGWRAKQVQWHRASLIELIRIRRVIKKSNAC